MPGKPPRLILASASPRRRQLLRLAGVAFTVRPSRLTESHQRGEGPIQRARRLAAGKAAAVAGRLSTAAWIMGVDTVVSIGGRVLDKPGDDREAARMLGALSGRWHRVITSVALLPCRVQGGQALHGQRTTAVRFAPLSTAQVGWLLAANEHRDKAGAYALQGRAGAVIREVRGSHTNVIGLPLDLVTEFLERTGYLPWTGRHRQRISPLPGRRRTRLRSAASPSRPRRTC